MTERAIYRQFDLQYVPICDPEAASHVLCRLVRGVGGLLGGPPGQPGGAFPGGRGPDPGQQGGRIPCSQPQD
jgi:hypothetical protein